MEGICTFTQVWFSGALYTSADPRMPCSGQRLRASSGKLSSSFEHYPGARVCVRMQEDAKFSTITVKCFQGLNW